MKVIEHHPILMKALSALFVVLCPTWALAAEWIGGRDTVWTISTIDVQQKAFAVSGLKPPIWAWTNSIRRMRPNGGTTAASFADLKPGILVRIEGASSSSPLGYVAKKIIILPSK